MPEELTEDDGGILDSIVDTLGYAPDGTASGGDQDWFPYKNKIVSLFFAGNCDGTGYLSS